MTLYTDINLIKLILLEKKSTVKHTSKYIKFIIT